MDLEKRRKELEEDVKNVGKKWRGLGLKRKI